MSELPKSSESITVVQLASELDRETDRALAIIAVAHLDDLLEQLVSMTLHIPTPKAHKSLFGGGKGPLGSIGRKIDFLRDADVLIQDEVHDLVLMSQIRNDFAHELMGTDFETSTIRDRCSKLKAARVDGDPGNARERFKKAAVRLIVDITLRIKKTSSKILW